MINRKRMEDRSPGPLTSLRQCNNSLQRQQVKEFTRERQDSAVGMVTKLQGRFGFRIPTGARNFFFDVITSIFSFLWEYTTAARDVTF